MIEKWRPIKGYELLYFVSTLGRIKNYRGKIIKPVNATGGYLMVGLYKNKLRKPFFIHRLVAIAFIANPKNKPFVNHKDFDKKNNKKTNLEWNTNKENIAHFKKNLKKHKIFLLKEKAIKILKKDRSMSNNEIKKLFNFFYRNF